MEFYDPTSPLKDSWNKKKTIEYWNSRAQKYEDDFNKTDVRGKMIIEIAKEISKSNVDKVLDIGTGSGRLIFQIEKRKLSSQYYGIDPATDMIKAAREVSNHQDMTFLHFLVSDAIALPYKKFTFDAVISSMSLHHLNNDEKKISLKEIKRVLKPNGKFVIADLLFSFSPDDFTLEEVRTKVQKTFFPNEPLKQVKERFRDEPKEWPVTINEYENLLISEGFIIKSKKSLNEVVSVISVVIL